MTIKQLLVILLCLTLCGCSTHDIIMPDGTAYHSVHVLDSTKIGSISYDEGSFVLEGYLSETDRALMIIQRLLVKYEEMLDARRLAVGP